MHPLVFTPFLISLALTQPPAPEVTITQGKIKGSTKPDLNNQPYHSFRGIPYAQPPIGNLRFKAPKPHSGWTGTLDGTKEPKGCYNRNPITNLTEGSEDCLFLNVFTRTIADTNPPPPLKPVMVWIHGGAFVIGSSTVQIYGPQFLMTEDIVLVTLNYRLGLPGFFSLGDALLEVPGNAAFRDMVLALKWVQRDIRAFGGDPTKVTIFGESAGSVSVHLLVLSPLGKGLFHRAIAQSGSALNTWAKGRDVTIEIAEIAKRDAGDQAALLGYLQELPIEQLFQIQEELGDDLGSNSPRPFGYMVEPEGQDAFIAQEPIDLILAGQFNQVPFMVGFTSCEGMIIELFQMVDDVLGYKMEDCIPAVLGYTESDAKRAVAQKIQKFYYGDEKPSRENLTNVYNFESDVLFTYGIHLGAKYHARFSASPVFFYKFSLETKINVVRQFFRITLPGVSHFDDVGYLFRSIITPKMEENSLEERSVRKMLKLWTDFARFGNPTPEGFKWEPVLNETVKFVDIGEELVAGVDPFKERMEFWKGIYAESPAGKKFV